MASKALDRGYKNDFFQESLIKYEVHTMSITSTQYHLESFSFLGTQIFQKYVIVRFTVWKLGNFLHFWIYVKITTWDKSILISRKI